MSYIARTATELSDADQRILLLAKDLFRRGCDAAREGSRFSSGVAVSHFHDAAEVAARGAAIRLGVNIKPEANFLTYWQEIELHATKLNLPQRLRHRAEMGDLNEVRRLFKHRGRTPDSASVAGFRATTMYFLKDTFSEFFSIDLDAVSSVAFVRDSRISEFLSAAHTALRNNNAGTALERCSDAWAITAMQQRVFFPSREEAGWPVSFDSDMKAIYAATRGDFSVVFDHINKLAQLTFAALLGLNAADVLTLVGVLPLKQGDQYIHRVRIESVSIEQVAYLIDVIGDYSTALMRHIDRLTHPPMSGPSNPSET